MDDISIMGFRCVLSFSDVSVLQQIFRGYEIQRVVFLLLYARLDLYVPTGTVR